jgi:hypothetical protein
VSEIDDRSESSWRRATLFAKIAVVDIALLCLIVLGTILYVHFTTPHPPGD